jgi:cytochrome c553
MKPRPSLNASRPIALIAASLLLGAAAPPPDAQQGEAIVTRGSGAGVLPCMACHGQTLAGNAAIGAPPLAGLKQATTLSALAAIASGAMGHNYVMKNIAHALTAPQRQAVADYLAGLEPTAP